MDSDALEPGGNLLEQILRQKENLRKSDRRVAEVVLERPFEVVDMTLAKLADTAGVSEPTVIRFCGAIGCDGFRDMRVKLAGSLAFARSTSHTAISADDELGSIVTKIFDYSLSNLKWAQGHLLADQVKAAVDALSEARRIEFFGFGASGIVALDGEQKFPLFGIPCAAHLDPHQMFMTCAMLHPGDVAVAISNTGQTREVVLAMEKAHAQEAKTIGITGTPGSPLLDHCDIQLVMETLENTDVYTPTVSRLSHLVLIDILSTAVSLRRGKKHHERIVEMKTGLARLRSSTEP